MVEFQALLRSAESLGIGFVSGFTGSPIWSRFWTYPTPGADEVEEAFGLLSTRFQPVLDACLDCGIRFALEIHPGQMAFDIPSTERLLETLSGHQALGFTLDPAHLVWQGVDPVQFVQTFADRIWHVHLKDVTTRLDGGSSLINPIGSGRGLAPVEYRAPGRGSVDWESLGRALVGRLMRACVGHRVHPQFGLRLQCCEVGHLQPCWRAGNQVWGSTVDVLQCVGQHQKITGSTSTYAVPTEPWPLLERVEKRNPVGHAHALKGQFEENGFSPEENVSKTIFGRTRIR